MAAEHSAAPVDRATLERDWRLDFFRGLALFCIFVDHVPNNFFADLTIQSVGVSDAAEIFILISGYTAGLVFGGVYNTRGWLASAARIYHRVWQLYVAHVFLFVLFVAMMAHTMGLLNNSIYAEESGAADFLREPDVAVVMALTLRFQPEFMDILPLYIVLLGTLPLMLALFRQVPIFAMIASFLLWLASQLNDQIAFSAYPGPDSVWFFNPCAWQFLFFFGAFFGSRGMPGASRLRAGSWITAFAWIIAIIGLVLRLSWTLHYYYDPFPSLFEGEMTPLLSKTNLSAPRLINVIALAILTLTYIGPRAPWLDSAWARPVLMCGRNSLHVFCLGILLSVLAHLLLNEYFGGLVMQAAVTVAGVAIMIGVAALMEWFRKSVRPAAAAPAGGSRLKHLALVAGLLLASAGAAQAEEPAAAEPPSCAVPEDAFEFEPLVNTTRSALVAGKEITIVAIGGASTLGLAAGGPDHAWPARMAEALQRRYPNAKINVVNKSVARQRAAVTVERLQRDVAPANATLVIWETGTNEAVEGVDLHEFRNALKTGIAKLRAIAPDLILMDMQYSRLTDAVIYFNRYLVSMRSVADVNDVPLFPRHTLMRDWAESGAVEASEPRSENRRAVADKLYGCLGEAMAEFIARPIEDKGLETTKEKGADK
jgi:hypothetical protein